MKHDAAVTSRLARAALAAAVAFGLGCSSGAGLYLMPAPDVVALGIVNPFEGRVQAPPGGVLYATDRVPAVPTDEPPYYDDDRGHWLRVGAARLTLDDPDITWDELRKISVLKQRSRDYPLAVEEVQEFGVLPDSLSGFTPGEARSQIYAQARAGRTGPARRFAKAVDDRLEASDGKDVYIYVHGFKVDFANPLLIASELWHFVGYRGAFIAYSWPATPSIWAYGSDVETTEYAARNFRIFLDYLARETQAERIHIVAYSAGTRVVTAGLGQLALMKSGLDDDEVHDDLRIGHVILTASDVDRARFAATIADGALRIPEQMTVYLSESDQALGFASRLFTRSRVGQISAGEEWSPGTRRFLESLHNLTFIDATDAEGATSGNGHGYFRDSPWVSSDILLMLLEDRPPADRGLLKDEDQPFWHFPPDYVDRLSTSLGSR